MSDSESRSEAGSQSAADRGEVPPAPRRFRWIARPVKKTATTIATAVISAVATVGIQSLSGGESIRLYCVNTAERPDNEGRAVCTATHN